VLSATIGPPLFRPVGNQLGALFGSAHSCLVAPFPFYTMCLRRRYLAARLDAMFCLPTSSDLNLVVPHSIIWDGWRHGLTWFPPLRLDNVLAFFISPLPKVLGPRSSLAPLCIFIFGYRTLPGPTRVFPFLFDCCSVNSNLPECDPPDPNTARCTFTSTAFINSLLFYRQIDFVSSPAVFDQIESTQKKVSFP